MNIGLSTYVRRIIYTMGATTLEAKLGNEPASCRTRLDTLFCGLDRDKTYPSISGASVNRTRGASGILGEHDGVKAAVSAQSVGQN